MKNKIVSKIGAVAITCSVLASYTTPVLAITKEETVYSKINSNGENYNTIVSNHLINEEKEKIINDISDLLNIENTKGDESPQKEENKLIWKAEGKDIYYQGESKKNLPIECKIKYELDGKDILAEDLVGKSGKVKITIEYINKDEHIVKINGKEEKIYTPFTLVCASIINNDNNTNIKITNGKVIDDGSKTIVMGMAFPGLQESLAVSKDKIEIPNKLELTMESTNFELGSIITYITPKIAEKNDIEVFDEIDNIISKVNTLSSSSKQLVQGAKNLQEGINTYTEKSQEFNSAIKQISSGMTNANRSYNQIDIGINTLNNGTKTLKTGAKTINEGAKQISSNLKLISEKMEELQNGSKSLLEGQTQVSSGIDKIVKEIEGVPTSDNTAKIAQLEQLITANKNTIASLEKANASLKASLNSVTTTSSTKKSASNKSSNKFTTSQASTTSEKSASSQNATNVDKANKNTSNASNNNNVASGKGSDSSSAANNGTANNSTTTNGSTANSSNGTNTNNIKQTINAQIEVNNNVIKVLKSNIAANEETIKTLKLADTKSIQELKKGLGTLKQGIEALKQGSQSLYEGQTAIKNGVDTLNEKTSELAQGTSTLYEGTNTLAQGTTKLNLGSSQIKEGLQTLDNGAGALLKADNALVDGSKTMLDGSIALAEGMQKFDKEGVQSICNFISGDLKEIETRVKELQKLADEYNNFSMMDENSKGNVKFIIIMDEIKKVENGKPKAIIDEKK